MSVSRINSALGLSNFNTISFEELVNIIIELHSNNKLDISWVSELEKRGYAPKFVGINFFKLHFLLKRKSAEIDLFRIFFHNNNAFNLTFENCVINDPETSNFITRLGTNGQNCEFIGCNFTSITNHTFTNCHFVKCKFVDYFKHVEFNNCEHTDGNFLNAYFHHSSISNNNFLACTLNGSGFYYSILTNINFNKTILEKCEFEYVGMNDINLKDSTFVKNQFKRSRLINLSNFKPAENQLSPSDYVGSGNWLKFTEHLQNKKIIIIIYTFSPTELTNTNALVKFIDKYTDKHHFELMLIHPDEGMQHPIFSSGLPIHGIVLPGGHDIDQDSPTKDKRQIFEMGLVKKSKEEKTPLIGVCRGHQLYGYSLGLQLRDLGNDDHMSFENEIRVTDISSAYYQRLERKYLKMQTSLSEKLAESSFKKDPQGVFTYSGHCMHTQALFFARDSIPNSDVKIVARAKDNTIEALENSHVITLQHHFECDITEQTKADTINEKLARTALRHFIKRVIDYSPASQPITNDNNSQVPQRKRIKQG